MQQFYDMASKPPRDGAYSRPEYPGDKKRQGGMTAGSSRKTAGSRLAFFCPLFEKRRASFTVLPRNFSFCSDFYSSCSAREGLQPNVPGAPWVSFGLQSYLLFLGSTLLITSNPTPAVTACFALLGIAFSPSAFGR